MPDLSIVIINYNTYQLTVDCIHSIQAHMRLLDYEIILVDNASKECPPEKFKEAFPDIMLIALPGNVGFGRGNNRGIKAAKAPVILLINSDTIIFDNAIEQSFHFLISQPDVGMIGCKLLNEDGSEQISSFIPVRFPFLNLLINSNAVLFKLRQLLNIGESYNHVSATLQYQKYNHTCEALSGAFMMIRREVIAVCGDFDPDFFMYCEDTEWCRNRIRKKFVIKYFAEAAITHLGGKSSASKAVEKQTLLSSFLYHYKTGVGRYIMAVLIYLFNSFCNFLAWPFLSRETRGLLLRQAKYFIEILPFLFWDIPRYKKSYGSRKTPLLIKEYQHPSPISTPFIPAYPEKSENGINGK